MSSPPPSDPEPPTLTPDVVADEEQLAEAVDQFLRREPLARERAHHIADHQEMLRQAVDSETWKLALRVDEMVTERWADVAVEIAKWAFDAGRRHPMVESAS